MKKSTRKQNNRHIETGTAPDGKKDGELNRHAGYRWKATATQTAQSCTMFGNAVIAGLKKTAKMYPKHTPIADGAAHEWRWNKWAHMKLPANFTLAST